jgi:hypothetical protein
VRSEACVAGWEAKLGGAAAGSRSNLAISLPARACWRTDGRFLDNRQAIMPTNASYDHRPSSEEERTYLESLIRDDFERCHPGETLEDLKRRASFSKEDRGLLRDWMAIAARRAAAERRT